MDKNRNREAPTFANINLLGKCNAQCFFCLGKDIPELLDKHNQLRTSFRRWLNLDTFLQQCYDANINKIYLTGQNTDPLLYDSLGALLIYLQNDWGFNVGIRTNGYLAEEKMWALLQCREEIGLSIHSISPMTTKMILGRADIPNWETIIRALQAGGIPHRVSVVINRCNKHEFWDLMRFLAQFKLPYVQIRKVSTDTRTTELQPDIDAYESLYTEVSRMFSLKKRLWEDAEVYDIFGVETCWWRTVKTSINSWNYFTDGTISQEYFIVEGYMKNVRKE